VPVTAGAGLLVWARLSEYGNAVLPEVWIHVGSLGIADLDEANCTDGVVTRRLVHHALRIAEEVPLLRKNLLPTLKVQIKAKKKETEKPFTLPSILSYPFACRNQIRGGWERVNPHSGQTVKRTPYPLQAPPSGVWWPQVQVHGFVLVVVFETVCVF
jgi:hypothetical protein